MPPDNREVKQDWPCPATIECGHSTAIQSEPIRCSAPPGRFHGLCSNRIWDRRDAACEAPGNWDRRRFAVSAAHRAPAAYRGALLSDDVLDLAWLLHTRF